MKVALVGEVRTAEFALRGLLAAGEPPALIVTTDVLAVQRTSAMAPEYYADLAARGREHEIPVAIVAEAGAIAGELEALGPDFAFVIGWPYLVREPLLSRIPCIGMHPTPLPMRRGGAPLNWTLLDGERDSAVSLFRLRPGLDDGELLAQRAFAVGDDEYVDEVLDRVCSITEALVAESARALRDGSAVWRAQDDLQATYTRRRRPEDGRITWCDSAARIRNLVRAVGRPFPGAFSQLDGCPVHVWRAEIPRGVRAPLRAAPGTILGCDGEGVLVGTRDNALRLTAASLDGGPALTSGELAATFGPSIGKVLT